MAKGGSHQVCMKSIGALAELRSWSLREAFRGGSFDVQHQRMSTTKGLISHDHHYGNLFIIIDRLCLRGN